MYGSERGFVQISEKELKAAYGSAFPVENIGKHDVTYSKADLKFIGSDMKSSGWIYDYYQGPDMKYWYKKRKLVDGKIVSEHYAIFGYEERERKWNRKKKEKKSSDLRNHYSN